MSIFVKIDNGSMEYNIDEIKKKMVENRELLSSGKIDANTYENTERSLLIGLENLFMSRNIQKILC